MKRQRDRTLKIEYLENRSMMAGNITAAQVGGDLIIEGDTLDNNLTIENTSANVYQLIGGADDGPRDTLVNGQDTSVVGGIAFTGVTGNIVIRLHGGNDHVEIGDNLPMFVNKALIVDSGDGHDEVRLPGFGRANIATEMLIDLGGGNDFFDSAYSAIGTSAIIDLGDGHDLARFLAHSITRDLVVRGAAGGDIVLFTFGAVSGFTLLDGGAGTDRFAGQTAFEGQVAFLGGEGADRVAFMATRFNGGVFCDHGTDFANTEFINCVADVVYIVGQGPHQIALSQLKARRIELGLTANNDTIQIDASAMDELYAALGSGDDQFVIRSTAVNQVGSVTAGFGFDRLLDEGNIFGQAHFVEFEVPASIQPRSIRRVA
jgi:hypothetical protein